MSKGKWGKALALGGLLALGIWLLWQMGLALLTGSGYRLRLLPARYARSKYAGSGYRLRLLPARYARSKYAGSGYRLRLLSARCARTKQSG